MLKMALLILTLTPDGAVRLTLSETESLEDCHASREVVTQLLDGAGVEILEAHCGETALRLTPFEHGRSGAEEIWRYLVEIDGAGFYAVRPLETAEECAPADEPVRVYCARSAQHPIGGS